MNAIITKKETFTSKLGKEFVKIHVLFSDGSVDSPLLNKIEYDEMDFDDKKILDSNNLSQLFDSAKDNEVKIDYNNRGRIAKIS